MIQRFVTRQLAPRFIRSFSSGHGVMELSEDDKRKLMLYPNSNFTRTTHFPIEEFVDLTAIQRKTTLKLYTYKSPAVGTPKGVLVCL